MLDYFIHFLFIALTALCIRTILPLQKKWAGLFHLIDKPCNRKIHSRNIPTSGGLSIYLSLLPLLIFLCFQERIYIGIFISASILLVLGISDDIKPIPARYKLVAQSLACIVTIYFGTEITWISNPFGYPIYLNYFGKILSFFWLLGIINAMNLIDGIDGLAISVVSIFLLSFELFSATSSDLLYLTLIILSSIVPLYFFNLRIKNKVFLGDSGSLLLGTVVSIYVLKILSQDYSIKPNYDLNKVIFVISILTYPIVDIIRIFILRLYQKKSPFLPDKQHIHHLILRKTEKHYLTTCIIVISSLIFAILIQIIF